MMETTAATINSLTRRRGDGQPSVLARHRRNLAGDMFVVRGVKLEDTFEKIGPAKNSYDDARKKYGRLTSEAL
jgi:hypothetical protein